MTIYDAIESLCQYGLDHHLFEAIDRIYIRNRLLAVLDIKDYKQGRVKTVNHFEILKVMVDYGYKHQLIPSDHPPYSDLFEAQLMDVLMPRPSEIIGNFQAYYHVSPKHATDYFYGLSKISHYIRTDRTSKNLIWQVDSDYGMMDITINLSKPEKDPKAIAEALKSTEVKYPKCLLCKENEGYSGHNTHPARSNHRIIPLKITDESWYFQYSPYAYFKEHSIVFRESHSPMVITEKTFDRLVDFVNQYPHYFIGSNADLPLVGGSMLAHDHYQAGDYVFPMERARTLKSYEIDDVKVKLLKWPLTVLRVETKDQVELLKVSKKIFTTWQDYKDPKRHIQPMTGLERHSTVTPILRKREGIYQMDIVLRNNRVDEKHPTGIFHTDPEVHVVKKENIGLIEVMGLAVLPSRLKTEAEAIASCVASGEALDSSLQPFSHLLTSIEVGQTYEETLKAVHQVIGETFVKGLEDCSVFKFDKKNLTGIDQFVSAIK